MCKICTSRYIRNAFCVNYSSIFFPQNFVITVSQSCKFLSPAQLTQTLWLSVKVIIYYSYSILFDLTLKLKY